MCLVKSPSAQSSNPSTPPSKHARCPSLTIQQRQQQQQQQESQLQYSAESLARHGIKVRDFAYESDLPLIPSIPRVRQLSLAGRPLKRTKHQSEQPDNDVFGIDSRFQSQSDRANPFWVSSLELDHDNATTGGIPNKSKPLERRSTEPAIVPERILERQQQRPFRDVGYADLSQHASGSRVNISFSTVLVWLKTEGGPYFDGCPTRICERWYRVGPIQSQYSCHPFSCPTI
ncbi:hypothetical protein EDB85DRAFT_2170239 [Lactarius pseudohatsudake]|nr:hypothetical protein EDB85DRAFT_2170239 [Lactarius pseudohatsudake]